MDRIFRGTALFLTAAFLLGLSFSKLAVTATAAAVAGVQYKAHVQSVGWQKAVSDGTAAGTTGRSLRLEALQITLGGAPAGAAVSYEAHVQSVGWQKAVSGGATAGTAGRSLRLEALKVTLSGMAGYAVKYRVHVQSLGWLAWQTSENGTAVESAGVAGTVGRRLRVEAVQIELVKTAPAISALDPVSVTTEQEIAPSLPETVVAELSDGTTKNCPVTWDEIEPLDYLDGGQFSVYGTVEGTGLQAEADVNVKGFKSWRDGEFVVGTDVPAGDYVVYPGSEDGGLFSVSTDFSVNPDTIIGGGITFGRSLLTVKEGECLILFNARMVPLASSDWLDPNRKQLVEGMYLVSGADPQRDISAGTYTITLDEINGFSYGVYRICSDAEHTERSAVSSGTVENGAPVTVTLQEGQYIELLGCDLS